MKIICSHLVPEKRLGGIFVYINRLAGNKSNYKHYLFKGQPYLSNLSYYRISTLHLRIYKSYLIILDLIINAIPYLIFGLKSNKIFCHTPFLIFYHLLFLALGKKSFLVLHDYNIPFVLKFIMKASKPENVFCASSSLISSYPWLCFAKVLPPYYTPDELLDFSVKALTCFSSKRDFIFLGNLNHVKQIAPFSYYFNEFFKESQFDSYLHLHGNIISNKVYNSILSLDTKRIKILSPLPNNHVIDHLRNFKFIIIPSESEVFPLVYFEALFSGVIPLVNNIDFFKSVSFPYPKHIFSMNEINSIYRVLEWSMQLDSQNYKNYLYRLKDSFLAYYSNYNSIFNHIFP